MIPNYNTICELMQGSIIVDDSSVSENFRKLFTDSGGELTMGFYKDSMERHQSLAPWGFPDQVPSMCAREKRQPTKYNEAFQQVIKTDNRRFTPKKIHWSGPVTCIVWEDGEKTLVRATENDPFDAEKGVAMCFMRRMLELVGDKKGYHDILVRAEQENEQRKGNAIDGLTEV